MDIKLNGKTESIGAGITIEELIRSKELDSATIVVEHNLSIVEAKDFDQITLEESDNLEILRFVGGG